MREAPCLLVPHSIRISLDVPFSLRRHLHKCPSTGANSCSGPTLPMPIIIRGGHTQPLSLGCCTGYWLGRRTRGGRDRDHSQSDRLLAVNDSHRDSLPTLSVQDRGESGKPPAGVRAWIRRIEAMCNNSSWAVAQRDGRATWLHW
ncbi:hypothetical protein BD309DRAFT_351802 [Dichomitus squalens]|nr:hypothetical protein BD309DRAFT_351802 [Dichomitus squalens]